MRKLLLCVAAVLLAVPATQAAGPQFGVGVMGGLDIPIVQDDQGSGNYFGFRARAKLIPLVVAEGSVRFGGWGDPNLDLEGVTNDLEGSDVTVLALDALLGSPMGRPASFSPFAILGFGSYKLKRDQTQQDESRFGWRVGLGLGLGFARNLDADVRGVFNIITLDGGGSRKSVTAGVGLNFTFGGTP